MLVFTRANCHHLLPLPCSCYRPAAGATLQGLCRKGYAAHAPTAALATQIGMLQLLHWPHRSACSNCCTGHTDQHAHNVALATQISMPQVLHWRNRSVCSNCCTGKKERIKRHDVERGRFARRSGRPPRGRGPPRSVLLQKSHSSTCALKKMRSQKNPTLTVLKLIIYM